MELKGEEALAIAGFPQRNAFLPEVDSTGAGVPREKMQTVAAASTLLSRCGPARRDMAVADLGLPGRGGRR